MSVFEKIKRVAIVLVMTTLIGGCGSSGNNNYGPPPPPQNPNPLPGSYGYGSYGSCGLIGGGQPVNDGTTYQANLYPMQNGQIMPPNGDSINNLLVSWANQPSIDRTTPSVVASGNLNLLEIAQGMPPICFSSNNPNGSGPSSGIMVSQNGIQITLYGQLSLPGGYTGQNLVQVLVNIGISCPATIYQNRLTGCVDVQIQGLGGQSYYAM
jgi:hypothetical protein